jgi:hypothetical protein
MVVASGAATVAAAVVQRNCRRDTPAGAQQSHPDGNENDFVPVTWVIAASPKYF